MFGGSPGKSLVTEVFRENVKNARTTACSGGDAVFGGSSGNSLVTEVFRMNVKNARKQGLLPAVGEMLCLMAGQVSH